MRVASSIGPPISADAVARELGRLEGRPVELVHMGSIAADRAATELKQVGYGDPVLIRYRAGDEEKCCVLHTMAPNWFGHDRRSDRAALAKPLHAKFGIGRKGLHMAHARRGNLGWTRQKIVGEG